MPIFQDCVFILVPKCASSSVLDALCKTSAGRVYSYNFHLAAKYVLQLPNSDKFSFAVFRNPLQRCVSMFHFMRGDVKIWFEKAKSRKNCRELWDLFGSELDVHVEKMLRLIELAETNKFDVFLDGCFSEDLPLSQSYYICDNDGIILVDVLCSFDNLDNDINAVMCKIGHDKVVLEHLMKSRKRRWQDYYTERLRRATEKALSRDMEIWRGLPYDYSPVRNQIEK